MISEPTNRDSFRVLVWVCALTAGFLSAATAYAVGIPTQLVPVAGVLFALAAWYGLPLIRQARQRRTSEHAREQARERYLLGFRALCAETAHEMSTPLATIALVLGDLRSSDTPPTDWKHCLDLMRGQLEICTRSLSELALAASAEHLGKSQSVSAKQLVLDVSHRFRLQRPSAQFRLTSIPIDDSLTLETDQTLSQALLNFLCRAADASPHSVELRVRCNSDTVAIEVLDRGPGVTAQHASGATPTTTTPSNRGSGLLIAQAVVERFGGTVQLLDRLGGGICVQIELPLSRSKKEDRHEDLESRAASR